MIVLVDTNVLLDVLMRREPHYRASAYVWTLAERGEIAAFISAISFNNNKGRKGVETIEKPF